MGIRIHTKLNNRRGKICTLLLTCIIKDTKSRPNRNHVIFSSHHLMNKNFPARLALQKLFPRFPATFSGITGLSPISSLFLNGKITHHYRHIQSTDFYFQVLLLWNYIPDSLVRVFLLFHDDKVSFIPFVPLINYYVSTLYPLFHCRLVATLLVIIYNYDNNNNKNNNDNENNNSNN